jgi:hypothetical protein
MQQQDLARRVGLAMARMLPGSLSMTAKTR